MIDKSLLGIRIYRGTPRIKHLLFVDDSLIFCKVNTNVSNNLQKILNVYALALRQCINTKKTTIMFNRNVSEMDKAIIYAMWRCRVTKQYKKYLDLSPMISYSKRKAFSEVKKKNYGNTRKCGRGNSYRKAGNKY